MLPSCSAKDPQKMMKLTALVLFLGLQACVGNVMSTSNPHIRDVQTGKCAAESCISVIEATDAIPQPLMVQPDTHMRTIMAKTTSGARIPMYLFKQPARLSELELPFKIVAVRTLPAGNIAEIPVDAVSASDSWFPGYSWSILVCQQCESATHIGWKFAGPEGVFYGLIVDYAEEKESTTGQSILEKMRIGMPAPAWMMAMIATTVLKAP